MMNSSKKVDTPITKSVQMNFLKEQITLDDVWNSLNKNQYSHELKNIYNKLELLETTFSTVLKSLTMELETVRREQSTLLVKFITATNAVFQYIVTKLKS